MPLKIYSVLINWNDDNDEGDYGAVVKANSPEQAEQMTRELMARDDLFAEDDEPSLEDYEFALTQAGFVKNAAGMWEDPRVGEDGCSDAKALCEMEGIEVTTNPEPREFGSLISCDEGPVWKAGEMETVLRNILSCDDASDLGSLANAIQDARALMTQIDKDVEYSAEPI